jgi:hypothetical protein
LVLPHEYIITSNGEVLRCWLGAKKEAVIFEQKAGQKPDRKPRKEELPKRGT